MRRCAKAAPRTTEAKEETKKEAQDAKDAKDKMPAREPIRMRRAKAWNVEVENAYRRGAASAASSMLSSPRRRGGLAAGRFGHVDGVEAASLAVLARESSTRRAARTARTLVARRFQCAGWRSAEEYAQGEYGDEISWFSDSGLVEKVQNRQGLFMYFKRFGGGVRLRLA